MKYAVTIPTPNQKAQTVAKCLWDNFIVHYGIPECLYSDQGPDFELLTIKELYKVTGIHKIRTTPYHPRGNPDKPFNRTLLNMLGTLENKEVTIAKLCETPGACVQLYKKLCSRIRAIQTNVRS